MPKAIHFKSGDTTLRGCLYTPHVSFLPSPIIIMTPGFGCWKEHGLHEFAEAFWTSGFSILAYDNRNFGKSGGEPRNEVDPDQQISDIKAAITFVQNLKTVNPSKIGLWGVSLSAGNAIKVAAQDKRVRCLCLLVPFFQGMKEKTEQYIEKILVAYPDKDILSMTIPVTSLNENSFSIMKQKSCYQFLTHIQSWPNQVTLCSLNNIAYFDITDQIESLDTPTFIVVADNDTVAPKEISLKFYAKLKAPKKLLTIKGEHFAPWQDAFDECCLEQIAWFKHYLQNG